MPATEETSYKTAQRRTRSLFITWGLMGLWHGANWTFVLWGLYHATCIWLQRSINSRAPVVSRFGAYVGWMVTLPAMMAAWIPFRARSLRDAFALWGDMLDPRQFLNLGLEASSYFLAAFLLIAMGLVYVVRQGVYPRMRSAPVALVLGETAVLSVITAGVIVFLEVKDQFIYFQF